MEERRSNKYNDSDTPRKNSRVNKNKLLYDELNNKIGFEEVAPVDNDEINLSCLDLNKPKRGEYQKIKDYRNLFANDNVKKIEEKKEYTPKTFDINVVLEEAKKNRKIVDELEKKRNITNDEYNILSSLNKKYLHKKEFSSDDEDELDTITNDMKNDISNGEGEELFSELLASTTEIKLESNLSTEEINKIYSELKYSKSNADDNATDNENNEDDLENSFYTKSLDLSNENLTVDDEFADEEEYKSSNNIKIVIISLLLLLMLLIVIYFLFKHFNIVL